MPELPEVETVKTVLKPIVIGRKILSIDILRSTNVLGDKKAFVNGLTNETFLDITRIGKFLIFHLTNNKVMISHLRMEGKYFDVDEKDNNSKYARVVFHLDNNRKICYDDSRCFGILKLSSEENYHKEKELASLGPEPFDVDPKYLFDSNKKNNGPIKSTLLDQTLMTGLGNIYVDETLFACHIHPETPAKLITLKEWKIIKEEASRILKQAIVAGGSTIRSYHPGKDIDGNFQSELLAYGKYGQECPICHQPFKFIKVGGRGTTFCSHCQMKKGPQIKIAIYGKIAAGKSEVLKMFNKNGCTTISADDVVATLYQKEEVIKLVNRAFDLKGDKIDRKQLKECLIKNPKNIKKLDRLIHPLVKKEIEVYFKEHKNGLLVAEVPLLYEAKMENQFDYVVFIDIDSKIQRKRLEQRNKNQLDMLIVNSNAEHDLHKKKADFVINNNHGLIDLEKQVIKIVNKLKGSLN